MNIYLAGTGSDPLYAMAWREEARQLLYPHQTFNPFRNRTIDLATNKWDNPAAYTSNEIVMRDLGDVDYCDFIIAEFQRIGTASYIGTPMEVMYAWMKRKPVVLWIPKKDSEHFWLRTCSVKALEELEDVCNYVKTWSR